MFFILVFKTKQMMVLIVTSMIDRVQESLYKITQHGKFNVVRAKLALD